MKKIKKSYEKWYIYLIFQVTFIFLTQIYYNMNFITLSSNFITRFPWYFKINLRWLLLEDYSLAHKKWISLNMTTKLVLKKHLTWSKLYLAIISALELKVNKQKSHLLFSTKIFWFFFSELLCSIWSSHFRPFNFMCSVNR